jgi:arylsulfatase A-like enzyme
MRVNQTFSRQEVRDIVGPAYMGLIKELDDQIGRLLEYLEQSAQMNNTMVVFTSDHGDNLGRSLAW